MGHEHVVAGSVAGCRPGDEEAGEAGGSEPAPAAQGQTQQPSADAAAARQAQAAKAARDQELNRKNRERAERKARALEVRQLIEQHRVPRIESDESFNFTDGRKIHRIGVNAETRAQIQRGELVIVRYLAYHALVPADIAAKIRERDEHAVVKLEPSAPTTIEDDQYKDY